MKNSIKHETNDRNELSLLRKSTGVFNQLPGWCALLLVLLPLLTGCEKDELDPVQVIPSVNVTLPADPGEIGIVIDTRDIFRKGYTATIATINFAGPFSVFNTVLDIDPIVNTAFLRLENESLTPAEREAFADGVSTSIIITDADGQVLSEENRVLVLNDSGEPIYFQTTLPYKFRPVLLKENVPYYIQPREIDGESSMGAVLKSYSPNQYEFVTTIDSGSFNFKYFVKPASDSSYFMLRAKHSPQVPTFYFYRPYGSFSLDVTTAESEAMEFVFEQEKEGWIRIREAGTKAYMNITDGTGSWKKLRMSTGTEDRFRFLTPSITWNASDRGTVFQQPIMPAAKIDFAYESTILNCSSGNLTETVGVTKTRASTRTTETTESLQIFTSFQRSLGVTLGADVGASVPAVGEVSASVEFSRNFEFTTSATVSTENKLAHEYSETSEVSRTRTLEILPYSGVEVYDAVRTVKNARIPFTQVLRLTATYKDGSALTGDELMTQMLFNLVEGVPVTIGVDYVDISLRGNIRIDQMFEAETGAKEIPDACN